MQDRLFLCSVCYRQVLTFTGFDSWGVELRVGSGLILGRSPLLAERFDSPTHSLGY